MGKQLISGQKYRSRDQNVLEGTQAEHEERALPKHRCRRTDSVYQMPGENSRLYIN